MDFTYEIQCFLCNELQIDNQTMISTFIYKVDNERLFQRDEHRDQTDIDPYYLTDDNAIILETI